MMIVKTVPAKPLVRCKMGKKCLYVKALKLHEAYRKALKSDNALMKERQERLQMAKFVKMVAEHAAKSDPDIWEHLLVANKSGKAASFANSFLRSDIKDLEHKLKATIEAKAKDLINLLKKKKFQDHLVQFHQHPFLEDYSIYDDQKLYEPLSPDKPLSQHMTWHHMDHCLAVLTDQLAMSDAGRQFLEDLLVQPLPPKSVAFKEVWGRVSKAKTVAGPLAKFVYNVSPVVVGRIKRAIHQHKLLTIQSVLDDPEVKEVLSKLAGKFNIQPADLNKWIAKRAEDFAGRVAKKDVSDLKKLVDTFDDVAEQEFDAVAGAKDRLNSAWLRVTFGTIAFFVSTAPLMAKLTQLKKTKARDWIGLVGNMADFAKTIAEIKEAHEIAKGTSGKIANSATAATFAKTCGVVAGITGAILNLIEVDAALKSKDSEKMILAWSGAVVGITGFVASIISATLVSGVLAVVGVAIAIVASVLLNEHPVAAYLARTPWGTDQLTPWGFDATKAIHISKVIDEYYKTFFTLSVALVTKENDPYIKIKSHALSKTVPIKVRVTPEEGGASKTVTMIPNKNSVNGKGHVERVTLGWDQPFMNTEKEVQIHRPWEIWPHIKMDDDTEYTLAAKMDIDDNTIFELTAEASGVSFPPLHHAALAKQSFYTNNTAKTMFEDKTIPTIFPTGIEYPQTGHLRLNVYAKFVIGCKVNVFAEWDDDEVQEGDTGSETHPRKLNDAYDTFEKTTIGVRVSHPKDGSYEVELRWVLLVPDGTEKDEMKTKIKVLPN